jgi:excisionase family DNA binding protein
MRLSSSSPTDSPELVRLLTVNEAAELLACTPNTIYRLIYRGALRSTRVGRAVRIHPDSLRERFYGRPAEDDQPKPVQAKSERKPRKGKRFDDFLMP